MSARTRRHRGMQAVLSSAAIALLGITIGCADSPEPKKDAPSASEPKHEQKKEEPDLLPPSTSVTTVTKDLKAPWDIAFYDDETALISERDSGKILELNITDGKRRDIGTVPGVKAYGEAGLLGLAIHKQQLYVYSTAENGNRVQKFALKGKPGALKLGDADTLISKIPAAENHNGGRIAFGPDGMLYVATGDANDFSASQDKNALGGKILRITPDGDTPDDNPHEDSLMYSYGHRNVQGIAWDDDDKMYASEFGQDTWDELNVIKPDGNYGWPEVEGIAHDNRFIDPEQQWRPADASPSGITIADDSIYMANLRGQRLREIPLDDLSKSKEYYANEYGRMRHVTVAPNGDLWLLTNNTDSRGEPQKHDDKILSIAPDSLD
jgi:glucose/arabinose dehydrogenase